MNPELPIVGLVIGSLFILKHFLSIMLPVIFKTRLQKFPRSRTWGISLLLIATIWSFLITTTTDLGEFSSLRTMILAGIVIGSGLFAWFVPQFLAIRSLGFILLLLAHPVLEITFFKSGLLPLLLSLVAYAWIIAGLFMVGMPYLLRDVITFITAPSRSLLWKSLSALGLMYGLLLVIGAVLQLLK